MTINIQIWPWGNMTDYQAPPAKENILIEDFSSNIMKPVWNQPSFCGAKKNKGKVKYWRTLLSSGPILNWGKQNIGFFFRKTSSANVIYLVLIKLSNCQKHFLAYFAETTLACPFQSPARWVLSPGTAPRYYIEPGNLSVLNPSKIYSHDTNPSWVCIRWVLHSARDATPSENYGNRRNWWLCLCIPPIDPWC